MAPSVFIPRDLYGVIGWPLGQSLSPLIHNTAFQSLEMPGVYLRWEIRPADLAAFVEGVRVLPIRGCSVTIPHKIDIMPMLDSLGETAALAGAVNTLFWKDNALCGENTDVEGFLKPLEGQRLKTRRVLLLGAGGAAHAAAAGLHMQGCSMVWVCTPGNRRHLDLATRFGFSPVPWADRHAVRPDFIINATPLGMAGKHAGETPYDFSRAGACSSGLAYDIVYNPLQTRFLAEAARAGWRTISGEKMFIGQAGAQFRRWTGQGLPDAALQTLYAALQPA